MNMIQSQTNKLVIKTEDQLPSHIRVEELNLLYNAIDQTMCNNENKYYENKYTRFTRDRDKMLCWWMFISAGRVGDVSRMRFSNIDFVSGVLSWVAEKNGRNMRIPINKIELLAMENYYLRWIANMYAEDYLFPTNRSMHISRKTCWQRIHDYGKVIGMHLHPHMFRHGMAIHMLRSGRSLYEISLFLGDRIDTVARHYLVVTDSILREIRGNIKDITIPNMAVQTTSIEIMPDIIEI